MPSKSIVYLPILDRENDIVAGSFRSVSFHFDHSCLDSRSNQRNAAALRRLCAAAGRAAVRNLVRNQQECVMCVALLGFKPRNQRKCDF